MLCCPSRSRHGYALPAAKAAGRPKPGRGRCRSPTRTCIHKSSSMSDGQCAFSLEEAMRRRLGVVALLASLALAATARICVGAPLPAAQSDNQNALVAKAQAALDAKQWPDAEAALKSLSASEPRWEYSQALGVAQFNQGHYADSLESYQRAIDLAQKTADTAATAQLYTMLGNANLKLKNNDAAIAAYNK